MPEVRGHQALHIGLARDLAEIGRAGVRIRAHAGLGAMGDERLGKRAFVDQQVRILRQAHHGLARRGVAAERDDLAFRLHAHAEAFTDLARDVLDPIHRNADLAVLEDNARADFTHLGPRGLDIGLAHRIGAARPEVGLVRAVLEQVVDKVARAFRPQHQRRALLVQHPAGDHEIGVVADMVVVQMRQEHKADLRGVDIGAHHLARGALAAIEQIVRIVIQRQQDGGLAPVGIGQRGAGAQHRDLHGFPFFAARLNCDPV
ncbi:hypothetical protein D9M68_488280 [compost metagenome]